MGKRELYIEQRLQQARKEGVVCLCKQVSERKIRKAVQEGHRRFVSVKRVTGAASSCGLCQPFVEDIIENEKKKMR